MLGLVRLDSTWNKVMYQDSMTIAVYDLKKNNENICIEASDLWGMKHEA